MLRPKNCPMVRPRLADRGRLPWERWRGMSNGVSIGDVLSDKDPAVRDHVRIRSTDQLFNDYFRPAGVSESWIAVTRHAMRQGDVWRTGQALFNEKAGVIQRLN